MKNHVEGIKTKKGEILLSVNRSGEFVVKLEQQTEAQCGKTGKLDYKYEVKIEATNKALIEPKMFVVDNLEITDYFERRYVRDGEPCPSCEVMACEAIDYFKSLFFGEDAPYRFVDVRRIYVVLRGADVSYITAEWKAKRKKGEEL